MLFPAGHWAQDWKLLADIAAEWASMREFFHLGSKATREQIEEHWDAIFKAIPTPWPAIRRIHNELMADEALTRHLRKCYRNELKSWEQMGYEFEEVQAVVLTRLFWQVVRNAHRWLGLQGVLPHWAVFWNTRRLTKELRRAIKDMVESEGSVGVQLPDAPTDDRMAKDREPEQDYRGRRAEGAPLLLQEMLEHCRSAEERALVQDWYHNGGEYTEAEDKDIAERHRLSPKELNVILHRILHEIKSDHKRRRPGR